MLDFIKNEPPEPILNSINLFTKKVVKVFYIICTAARGRRDLYQAILFLIITSNEEYKD